MDRERWARVQSLFHGATGVAAAERRTWLEARSGGDATLVDDVLAMVEADAASDALLDAGVGEVAQRMLGSAALPERVGPYRILGVAGRGGMGVVYLAEREDIGKRVAIKVLSDATLSVQRRERFAAEQRLLAQLEHANIARLYDALTLPDGTPCFVMEYVSGEPVTAWARRQRLSVRERLELFLEVCAGVQHAHAAAVIHRDLKPSNILVREDGVVKLLDFGIARQLDELDGADATITALRLMTPAYAAPEQLTGGAAGTFTDVYALGCILYELLTGRAPIVATGLTPGQLETRIVERDAERASSAIRQAPDGAPPDARQLGAAAWHDLDVLCQAALHRDPQRRYRTVEAFARDVRHFLSREPLEARPDSAAYRARLFLRRNWKPALAAAAMVLALGVVSAVYTLRVSAARDAALVEAARAQQAQRFVLGLFQGGDEHVGPASDLRVVTLLDRGVRDAGMLDRDPRMQAEMFATLGGIYRMLGDFERADSLLVRALGQRRALFGESHADVAASLVALSELRIEQAELAEAEQLARAALDMARRTLPPHDPRIGAAAATLGQVLQARAEYAAAIPLLEEAIAREGDRPSAQLAGLVSTLAATHYFAGNYAASDSLNRRSQALHTALFGERHPSVADDLMNLGAVRSDQGLYDEAEQLYRQALDIKLAYHGEEHHRTAASRTVLGRVLVAQGRLDEALEQLAPALQTRERVFGSVHPAVASTLNEIGSIALAREDYPLAERSYLRALAIYDEVHGDSTHFSGVALSNLGSTYMDGGDPVRAEAMFRRAVAVFSHALSPEHTNTAIARIKLGRSLRQQGRCGDAVQETLAGYAALSREAQPGIGFLQAARADLARCYDTLGQPAEAQRWRDEHARYAQ